MKREKSNSEERSEQVGEMDRDELIEEILRAREVTGG